MGGCDVTDNIDSVPVLATSPAEDSLASPIHRYLRYDGRQDMASCNATFTVAVATDLTVDCPDDP